MGIRALILGRSEVEERSTLDLSRVASMFSDSFSSYSPVPVSTATALTNAACSAVVDTLASAVSVLPIYGKRATGGRLRMVNPTPTLLENPSSLLEQDVWMHQVMESCLTDGNAYGEMEISSDGYPVWIELLNPDIVTDGRVVDGKKSVLVNGERRFCFPHGNIFHVPGPLVSARYGPFGASPIERARSVIGSAIAARDFGAKFFGDGGHPGGIITAGEDLTAEQAKQIKVAFINATRGNREPAVFGSGLDYQPLMVDPNDSQFIDLMRFATEEACRFWRVPPAMVYAATSGQNVTYANVSQADLSFYKHSLNRHLRRIEGALNPLLPGRVVAQFDRDAVLETDPFGRSEIGDRRLRNGSLTINEYRIAEGDEPFPGEEFDTPKNLSAPMPTAAPMPPTGGADA